MRKPLLILAVALAVAAACFAGAYFCARHYCVQRMAQSTDDLDWLRTEFRLGNADLAKVRKLHEGYLPICERNCESIAAKKLELAKAVAAGTNSPATLEQLKAGVVALRTRCQSEMLAHFEEVSRAMPPAQGKRYLSEMKRLTLDTHEQVEETMSGTSGHGHEHH
jgi:hypothetical protein